MKNLILLAALVFPTGVETEGPFVELTFEQACEEAERTNTVVMIDFYTTWCGPCKKLDATTWKDKRVIDWLDNEAVCLKIDAEKNTDLAKRFKVDAYPTMIFTEPNGDFTGRIVGYKAPVEFLKCAADVMGGVKPSDRLRSRLATSPSDPSLKKDLARELMRERNYKEAHDLLLWCWDHGDDNPLHGFGGVRVSYLIGDLSKLATVHAPTETALTERRNKLQLTLLTPEVKYGVAGDLVALNRALGDATRNVVAYDLLRAKIAEGQTKAGQSALSVLFDASIPELLAARRYLDLVLGFGEPGAWYSGKLSRVLNAKNDQRADERFVAYLHKIFIQDINQLHEALAGTRKNDADASLIASALTEYESSVEVWNSLITSAGKANREDLQAGLRKDALEALPEIDHAKLAAVGG